MTQTHTPGPWVVARGDSVYARRGDGIPLAPIADCNTSRTVTAADRAANAALIAAAPELLAALRALLPVIDKAWEYDGDVFGMLHNAAVDADAAARAAIAKAEGRS